MHVESNGCLSSCPDLQVWLTDAARIPFTAEAQCAAQQEHGTHRRVRSVGFAEIGRQGISNEHRNEGSAGGVLENLQGFKPRHATLIYAGIAKEFQDWHSQQQSSHLPLVVLHTHNSHRSHMQHITRTLSLSLAAINKALIWITAG